MLLRGGIACCVKVGWQGDDNNGYWLGFYSLWEYNSKEGDFRYCCAIRLEVDESLSSIPCFRKLSSRAELLMIVKI
jgi:hypothetical protein